VTSHTTERFRKAFQSLPSHVQRKARAAYRLWQQDHWHASLQFKQVHDSRPIYSVRIGIGWRALGVTTDDTIIWFWIGSHAEYDNILAQL
jgi:hypothetical protein